jgi:exodeoxyribonuclease VII large subunit
VLRRGYAIVSRESDGRVVRSSAEVAEDACIQVRLAKGQFRAKVLPDR